VSFGHAFEEAGSANPARFFPARLGDGAGLQGLGRSDEIFVADV